MSVRRVLIVDDSKVSRIMIRRTMSAKHPDWVYDEAANVEEAVALVTASPYDLVSMDWNMPGKNGLEGIELLRAVRPDLAITMFTANVQQAARDQAEALGVAFVDKPVSEASINRLLASIGG